MKRRPRIYYTESQKALMWERWQKGESLQQIAQLREHIGAIARFSQDYPRAEFWWSGVELVDDVFAWPFDYGEFAKSLPTSHRSRAATWLALLGDAIELEAAQAASPENLGLQLAAAWATTLCEWLHGFEAASGNGYNHFEEELESSVFPSDFFLGFELARLTGDDLESLCDQHAEGWPAAGVIELLRW